MKTHSQPRNNRQEGFSLIEMMVAILISTILLLGVLELFGKTFRTDRTHTELARVQETGRVAMELISREVRRAGYQGCASAYISTTANGITYPNQAIQPTNPATNSITFNYARDTGAGSFPNKDCDGNDLHPFQVTFSNCGADLCINNTDTGGAQTLTTNTQISALTFAVPNGVNTSWKAYADMAADDWASVSKLQISLAVNDSRGEFAQPRIFTSVIELRNRL